MLVRDTVHKNVCMLVPFKVRKNVYIYVPEETCSVCQYLTQYIEMSVAMFQRRFRRYVSARYSQQKCLQLCSRNMQGILVLHVCSYVLQKTCKVCQCMTQYTEMSAAVFQWKLVRGVSGMLVCNKVHINVSNYV